MDFVFSDENATSIHKTNFVILCSHFFLCNLDKETFKKENVSDNLASFLLLLFR